MAIYTKTGDKGQTALFGGKRVPKYDPQIESIGAIDETTSYVGFAIQTIKQKAIKEALSDVQMNLYNIMGYLAGAKLDQDKLINHLKFLEDSIDELDQQLPKLVRFVLPQGSEETVRLHLVRVTVRSAERRLVAFMDTKKNKNTEDELVLQYINRLSDFLFMLTRKYAAQEKIT